VAHSLSYLDNGIVFVGSRSGDSQVWHELTCRVRQSLLAEALITPSCIHSSFDSMRSLKRRVWIQAWAAALR
jgi:hypothetical protein